VSTRVADSHRSSGWRISPDCSDGSVCAHRAASPRGVSRHSRPLPEAARGRSGTGGEPGWGHLPRRTLPELAPMSATGMQHFATDLWQVRAPARGAQPILYQGDRFHANTCGGRRKPRSRPYASIPARINRWSIIRTPAVPGCPPAGLKPASDFWPCRAKSATWARSSCAPMPNLTATFDCYSGKSWKSVPSRSPTKSSPDSSSPNVLMFNPVSTGPVACQSPSCSCNVQMLPRQ
jgi:hypothetical protein